MHGCAVGAPHSRGAGLGQLCHADLPATLAVDGRGRLDYQRALRRGAPGLRTWRPQHFLHQRQTLQKETIRKGESSRPSGPFTHILSLEEILPR